MSMANALLDPQTTLLILLRCSSRIGVLWTLASCENPRIPSLFCTNISILGCIYDFCATYSEGPPSIDKSFIGDRK